MSAPNVSRREFLAGLGALVVAVSLPVPAGAAVDGPAEFDAFVGIATDGTVTVLIPSSEMGQGVVTSLAMLVAEELDADWSKVEARTGGARKEYGVSLGPGVHMQVTGGSNSLMAWNVPMREAGAKARIQLVAAAAKQWDVDSATCRTDGGVVHHDDSSKSATYGEAAAAMDMRAPKHPALKEKGDWKLLGSDAPRNDLHAKVTGTAQFGADVRLPGMKYATAVQCPVFEGRVASVDDTEARKVPGVVDVLVFDTWVAVIADTWWPAKKAAERLVIDWDEGEHADLDSASISATLHSGLASGKPKKGRKDGKAAKVIDAASDVLEATYEVPYLDHAPMEPLNATAHVTADGCEVWAPNQAQTLAQKQAAKISGHKKKDTKIHTTFLGGGFGRRGNIDYVEQAVHIATRVDYPVQLVLTREEGTQHGFYRPSFAAKMRAVVREGEAPEALHARICGDNVLTRWLPKFLHGLGLVNAFTMEGFLHDCPYHPEHFLAEYVRVRFPVPIGFWRSVSHSHNAFFMESFLDEVAHASGVDPVEMRRKLISPEHPRHRAVLDKAAEVAGWGNPPEGRFQGIAMEESFGSICAVAVELSMVDGLPRVHKAFAAVDCGTAFHPQQVHAQMMGGVTFGLSSCMRPKITIANGRVQQGNFHDYPILRMNEAPEIESHIVDSGGPVGGIGEVAVPPVAPAVCNAIFAATGQRIRSLPILDHLEVA